MQSFQGFGPKIYRSLIKFHNESLKIFIPHYPEYFVKGNRKIHQDGLIPDDYNMTNLIAGIAGGVEAPIQFIFQVMYHYSFFKRFIFLLVYIFKYANYGVIILFF